MFSTSPGFMIDPNSKFDTENRNGNLSNNKDALENLWTSNKYNIILWIDIEHTNG